MATPASEASICAVGGAWACGIIIQIDSIAAIFARYPAVGIMLLSMIGAGVGWCLMLERGQMDTPGARPWRSMFSRLAIGAGVGIGVTVLYDAFGADHRGVWMLGAALVAMFPLEAASGKLPELIAKWRTVK